MKTYVLIVSKEFPKQHKKAGEQTFFNTAILNGINGIVTIGSNYCKVHTIRKNFDLWADRVDEVKKGNAVISIRNWIGKPYRSKQIEIYKLTKDNGVGVQEIFLTADDPTCVFEASIDDAYIYKFSERMSIAHNDGLSAEDFVQWFFPKGGETVFSGVIIHFTPFRYNKN